MFENTFKLLFFITLIRFDKLIVVQTLSQQKKYSYPFYKSRKGYVSKKQKKYSAPSVPKKQIILEILGQHNKKVN